jgi:hypothetical protein
VDDGGKEGATEKTLCLNSSHNLDSAENANANKDQSTWSPKEVEDGDGDEDEDIDEDGDDDLELGIDPGEDNFVLPDVLRLCVVEAEAECRNLREEIRVSGFVLRRLMSGFCRFFSITFCLCFFFFFLCTRWLVVLLLVGGFVLCRREMSGCDVAKKLPLILGVGER